jgi:hypothetical protein
MIEIQSPLEVIWGRNFISIGKPGFKARAKETGYHGHSAGAICEMDLPGCGDASDEESRAYTYLFASAPDLLEACKRRIRFLKSINNLTGDYDDCGCDGMSRPDVEHQIDDEIRAAIEKAEAK